VHYLLVMNKNLAVAETLESIAPRGHQAKRESIIGAAADVFCREGFGGACIDEIAGVARVSRQTVYNHYREKETLFMAVVEEVLARANAAVFSLLSTFPQNADNLEDDLVGFLVRLNKNCVCNKDGRFLRKLVQTEGARYPHLFESWRREGPLKLTSALAALFARLAAGGALVIDDLDVAARQFLALANADLQMPLLLGETPSDAELESAARNAVRTFMRAYGAANSAARTA
jgi:AcrR family transcriptional regulator